MLLLLLTAAAASPVAVDVAGMAPQLDIIRRDAAERGWRISCEGRQGEEGTLRLDFPPGVRRESVEAYFDPDRFVGSSAYFYGQADELPERCDHEPPTVSSSEPALTLAVGPRDSLTRLGELARACGFGDAAVRERRDGDLPGQAGAVPEDWLTLDAGEDIGARYGPLVCFVNLRTRMLSADSPDMR